jgi:hypothetical protein
MSDPAVWQIVQSCGRLASILASPGVASKKLEGS